MQFFAYFSLFTVKKRRRLAKITKSGIMARKLSKRKPEKSYAPEARFFTDALALALLV